MRQIAGGCGWDLSQRDLKVITGTTMTGDYDACVIASDNRGVTAEGNLNFSPVVLARTSISVEHWSNQHISRQSGHSHPGNGSAPAEGCCYDRKSQCIFIRSFTVRKKNRLMAPKVLKAAAEPKDPDCTGRDMPGETVPALSSSDYEDLGEEDSLEVVGDKPSQVGAISSEGSLI